MRICAAVGDERLILAVKHLHPRVCHRSGRGDCIVSVRDCARRRGTAADERGAGTEDSSVSPLCAAGAEFRNRSALCRSYNAVRLCSYQRLVI